MTPNSVLTMARELVELREEAARIKRDHSEVAAKVKELERNLHQTMVDEELKNFRIEGLGLFSQSVRAWTRVSDFEAAAKYFKEKGLYDEVFQIKPVTGRLNEIVKEEFTSKNIPVPEDDIGIEVTLTPTISIRRK